MTWASNPALAAPGPSMVTSMMTACMAANLPYLVWWSGQPVPAEPSGGFRCGIAPDPLASAAIEIQQLGAASVGGPAGPCVFAYRPKRFFKKAAWSALAAVSTVLCVAPA